MKQRVWIALLLVFALVAAACGDDDDSSGSPSGTAPEGDPIKIGYLIPDEGASATPGRDQSISMAIDEINADGGVLGRPLELTIYDSQFTPEQAVVAADLAIGDGADVLMGLFVTAQVKAVRETVEPSGIPMIVFNVSPETNFRTGLDGGPGFGMDQAFRLASENNAQTAAWIDYVVTELDPEKVGLLASTDDSSRNIGDLLEAGWTDAGIEVVRRDVPADSTDLTEAILAMTDVDMTAVASFPAISSLFLRQRFQNGITVPYTDTAAVASSIQGGLNPPEETRDVADVASCDASTFERDQMKDFREKYIDLFGDLSGTTVAGTPQSYDAVYFYAAAVEEAGSTDPAAVVAAMKTVKIEGVCGPVFVDEEHNLLRSIGVVHTEDGTAEDFKLVKYYENPLE